MNTDFKNNNVYYVFCSPIQQVGKKQQQQDFALLSSMLYFLTMSLRIFAECHANQQKPPKGPAMLMGTETKHKQQPCGPMSQQQGFSSTYRDLTFPTKKQVPHRPIGTK